VSPPVETHYGVLGLGPRASFEQIERAYRHAAGLYEEDALATYSLLDGEERQAARARVEEAYAVLKDPIRRFEYDRQLGLDAGPAPAPAVLTPAAVAAPSASRAPAIALPEPVTGADLKRFRESRGIALREIATASKVGVRYFEYIEADRRDVLPAPVYLRGFLQEYARVVGLDPRRTAESYLARLSSAR
jgi:flagellar biosynthesis protein FlhG